MIKRLIGIISIAAAASLAQQPPVSSLNARRAPAYLESAIIYQVWMRSFSPEGTIKAVTARLPYLADLGATIVYLTPINRLSTDTRVEYWSPRMRQSRAGGAKNPYRIADFDSIDPEFGSEADLKELVDKAHSLGLKVMMDVVFYHVGPDSTLMNRPGFVMRAPDGKVLTGHWNFPRLNFENPRLREYLIGNLVHWVRDCKVDGFRCDVAGSIPTDFWEQARDALDKVNPDVVMLEEASVPRNQLKAFDLSYNFSYYGTLDQILRNGEPASLMRQHWETTRARFPKGARLVRLNDNHDRNRVDMVYSTKGALATSVLNFTLDGVPFFYNGQEVGDGAPDDILSHQPIRWDLATFPAIRPRVEFYRNLFHTRRREAALTSGEVIWLNNSQPDSVLTFLRKKGGEEILVAISLSNRKCSVTVDAPDGQYTPLVTPLQAKPAALTASGGKATLSFGAFDFFIGKKK
jgi:glycosidase